MNYTIGTAQKVMLYRNLVKEFERRIAESTDENSRRAWQKKVDEHKKWIEQMERAEYGPHFVG